MYYRAQGYPYQKNINIPPNYRGNAFYDSPAEKTEKENSPNTTLSEQNPQNSTDEQEENSVQVHAEPTTDTGIFKQGSLLGKIGSEELLLLAIIFLISDSEGSDDILWLLILLLFIK